MVLMGSIKIQSSLKGVSEMKSIETYLSWLEQHFNHKVALGELGAWIIGFYLVIFLIVAIVRGKFKPVRDGNVIRIGPMLWSWLKIPTIFMALNIIPFLMYMTCTGNSYYDDCGPREECVDCSEVVVGTYLGFDKIDVEWLPTMANAYGKGVVKFQAIVAIAAGVVILIAILWVVSVIIILVWRLIELAGEFTIRQLRRIPIRL